MEQIRIVKLVNGDDIVCSLAKEQPPEKSPILRLVKPLQIKYVSQLTPKGLKDYIALIKWTAFSSTSVSFILVPSTTCTLLSSHHLTIYG